MTGLSIVCDALTRLVSLSDEPLQSTGGSTLFPDQIVCGKLLISCCNNILLYDLLLQARGFESQTDQMEVNRAWRY